jgi:small subunit ribosomal protein S13e
LKLTSEQVKEQIFKLAKKGLTPSQIGMYLNGLLFLVRLHGLWSGGWTASIFPFTSFSLFQGVILRDSHGVAQVRFVTGSKILRVLKAKGLAPDLPEDLYHLIKKAVSIRKHLERSRKVRRTLLRFL